MTKAHIKNVMIASRLYLSLVALLLSTGCAVVENPPVKPWVKPYERHYLADPLMAPSVFPLDDAYMVHMYRSREGGRGAEVGGGGGCGCN